MTPQEIERTIEFILQCQASTEAHLDSVAARLDSMVARLDSMATHLDSTTTHLDSTAGRQNQMQLLLIQMTELAQVQSERLDRHDENFRAWQIWQREALARLDDILARLK